jgi:N-glycosylase/DNA lyase
VGSAVRDRGQVQAVFPVSDYDLSATLSSGQAFRWQWQDGSWQGALGDRWVRLTVQPRAADQRDRQGIPGGEQMLMAETAKPVRDWSWLSLYLQLHIDLPGVLQQFPADDAMRCAVEACRGLRLLRQPPWECLASFILSSTKQIVQIRQIVQLLCTRFGEPLQVPAGHEPVFSFPSAATLSRVSESALRECKMGFRAPYLLQTARMVSDGTLHLEALTGLATPDARTRLLSAPGVGRKIADCVLLFAYGCQDAFPVDVWVSKALRELYFPRRRVPAKKLLLFSQTYFGAYAGYAQQYLFHYMRTRGTEAQGSRSARGNS